MWVDGGEGEERTVPTDGLHPVSRGLCPQVTPTFDSGT